MNLKPVHEGKYCTCYWNSCYSLWYTCQLFLSYRREIFILGVSRFQRQHKHIRRFLKTSENFRRHLNSSKDRGTETALTLPTPSLRTCITKHGLHVAPSAFYLKKEVSSFTHSFHFLYIIGLSLHIFGNCLKQRHKLGRYVIVEVGRTYVTFR